MDKSRRGKINVFVFSIIIPLARTYRAKTIFFRKYKKKAKNFVSRIYFNGFIYGHFQRSYKKNLTALKLIKFCLLKIFLKCSSDVTELRLSLTMVHIF